MNKKALVISVILIIFVIFVILAVVFGISFTRFTDIFTKDGNFTA